MRGRVLPVIALVMFTTITAAQDLGGQRDEGRGRWRRGRGPSIGQLVERLSEQIEFDAEQTARIDEIVAAHEERMQEVRAQWQEVRAAMEAGDEVRAAELRGQLRQQHGERGRIIREVFDEIEPVLYEHQREAFQQFREDFARRRGPGERGRMRQMIHGLPDALNMTEDQRKEFDELLATQRAMMRERMRQRWQQGEEGGFEGAERPGPPDFAEIRDEIFKGVAEILHEDQLELLAEYWTPLEPETATGEPQATDDFRLVLLAAKRARDLTREQKEGWRKITRDAMRSFRELRRTDGEGKAALGTNVKTRVLELLDDKQREEFKQNLEQLKSRQNRAQQQRRARRAEAGERVRERHPKANAGVGGSPWGTGPN